MSDYQSFLVPYDFSTHSSEALAAATNLARRLGGNLHLIHVIQPPQYAYATIGTAGAAAMPTVDMAAVSRDAMQSLNAVAEGVKTFSGKIELHVVEGTSIAGSIIEAAEKLGVDMIVMGTHGRTGLSHVFLGSVAERTLRSAPCAVLTVRSEEESDD